MLFDSRLHFLGRIPVDEQGIRVPQGRQATWARMLEVDLYYQSVVMPSAITGLSDEEYGIFKQGLKHIATTNKTQLLKLKELARKSYVKANKSVQEKEVDDLTNWIDRILDPSKGYTEAHTWTRGTSKAPPCPHTSLKVKVAIRCCTDTHMSLVPNMCGTGERSGRNRNMRLGVK